MKSIQYHLAMFGLLSAGMLTLTSCSSTPTPPPDEATTTTAYLQGVPGGVVVETYTMTANVTAVDTTTRTVTLVTSDGKKNKVKCGPEVINFDQIRVGDQLKVTVAEELVAYLAEAGAPPSEGVATVVALAPKGAKPGGITADTIQVTARIAAIDLKRHKATLQFPDGSARTVAVRKDVDLTQRKIGEEVVIRMTEALAISVEQP